MHALYLARNINKESLLYRARLLEGYAEAQFFLMCEIAVLFPAYNNDLTTMIREIG
jgi:hypothetical protein